MTSSGCGNTYRSNTVPLGAEWKEDGVDGRIKQTLHKQSPRRLLFVLGTNALRTNILL